MTTEVSGRAVFSGSGKTAHQNCHTVDASTHNDEIKTALEGFKTLKRNGYEVDATTFILPNLGPRLEAIAQTLHEGTGFALLRGLNTEDYTDEDNLIIFLGIGSYIGSQRGKYRAAFAIYSWIRG